MGYSSINDIVPILTEDTLLQLADDSNDGTGALTTPEVVSVVDQAIASADAEIDGYLEMVIDLPMETVPGLIRTLSARIAVNRLFARRGGAPDHWSDDLRAARATLDKLASGKLQLPKPEADDAEPDTDNAAVVSTRPPLFDDSMWRRF